MGKVIFGFTLPADFYGKIVVNELKRDFKTLRLFEGILTTTAHDKHTKHTVDMKVLGPYIGLTKPEMLHSVNRINSYGNLIEIHQNLLTFIPINLLKLLLSSDKKWYQKYPQKYPPPKTEAKSNTHSNVHSPSNTSTQTEASTSATSTKTQADTETSANNSLEKKEPNADAIDSFSQENKKTTRIDPEGFYLYDALGRIDYLAMARRKFAQEDKEKENESTK